MTTAPPQSTHLPDHDVLEQLRTSGAARERDRRHPFDEVRALVASGFTAATVPAEYGGGGLDLVRFAAALEDVAAADSNVAQLLRPHFGYVEQQLLRPAGERRVDDFARIIGGELFGTASHERGAATVGRYATRLDERPEGFFLSGTKHYSTGSLHADWISVIADSDDGPVVATVPTSAPGVTRNDDWDGFGQRLTSSGTTDFDDVRVEPDRIRRFSAATAPSHLTAFYELVLLATLAGIAKAVERDAIDFVRRRTRVYSHGSGATASGDPLVQETIGELSAAAFGASAAVAAAAREIDHARRLAIALPEAPDAATRGALTAAAAERAEAATSQAQLVVIPTVLDAATRLFEIGGASATSETLGFDRHWRNARTVASHNPSRYKARALGEYRLTGTGLVFHWSTGEARKEAQS